VATTFINVSINENIDKVMDLLKENLPTLKESYPQIIEGPLVVGVEALTEEVVKIKVTAKTNPEEHYSVQRGLLKYVKELFDENDIKISDQHNGNTKGEKNEL
jgi:small-conductance mechanosensitive channel